VPFWTLLLVVAALIALALYPPETLLIVFGLYALSGPVLAVVRRRRSAAETE
ncbi:MAG: CDP-diacylglycerol--serine O-phosphatidyltransferase, partial [Xanthomonadaceae bacterium]|nr:CDP-diacylglycerol--serine O-phosphatidyltransferase [Xanthomonadaceae bacterium]